jgi:hypothetical protein
VVSKIQNRFSIDDATQTSPDGLTTGAKVLGVSGVGPPLCHSTVKAGSAAGASMSIVLGLGNAVEGVGVAPLGSAATLARTDPGGTAPVPMADTGELGVVAPNTPVSATTNVHVRIGCQYGRRITIDPLTTDRLLRTLDRCAVKPEGW